MNGTRIFNLNAFKEKRAVLRNNQTEPEKKLWKVLRSGQLGVKFRRQHGVGRFIVDFYCPELSIVVELDGESHFSEDALRYDQERDRYLNQLGLAVIRFTNEDVMRNFEGVVEALVGIVKK